MMSVYAWTMRLRTCKVAWKPIWAFWMATMVSSRLTLGFSICTSRCKRLDSFWAALTELRAFFSSPEKPPPTPVALLASWRLERSTRLFSALFLLLPFVYLLAFIAPVTAMSIAADAVSWGERKQEQMKADLERLRIDTKKD